MLSGAYHWSVLSHVSGSVFPPKFEKVFENSGSQALFQVPKTQRKLKFSSMWMRKVDTVRVDLGSVRGLIGGC